MKWSTIAYQWLSTESEWVTSQVNKYGDNLRDSRFILRNFQSMIVYLLWGKSLEFDL